jgi:uncharacterized MnhB-related membrane protein
MRGAAMNYQFSRKKIFQWIYAAAAALIAMRMFFVQQLIAAFLLFSALSACIAVVVLILFMLDHAWQVAFARAEVYVRAFGRPAPRTPAPVNNPAVANMLTPILDHTTASNK